MKRTARMFLGVGALVLCASAFLECPGALAAGCDPDGTTRVVVDLEPPAGKTLAGVKVTLGYPDRAVRIPGSADEAEVKARLRDTPQGFLVAPNDLDYEVVVAMVGTTALPAGKIFSIEFDRCKGVARAAQKDFRCTVEQASTETGVLVDGATCTARVANGAVKANNAIKAKGESL